MLKIALTHSSFSEFGGAEQVIINQVKGLKQLGYEVTCFTSVSSDKDFPVLNVNCYGRDYPSPFIKLFFNISSNIITLPIIANYLKKYDVILAHHHPGPLVAYNVKQKFETPYIVYIHHLPLFLYPMEDSDNKPIKWGHNGSRFAIEFLAKIPGINQWLKEVDKRAVRNADAVLTNSRYIANQIKSTYNLNAKICRPGVDTSLFKKIEPLQIENFRKKYQLGKKVMLLVARMTPQKKFDWAIEIFKKVKKKIKDAQLVIKTEIQNSNKWLQSISQMNYYSIYRFNSKMNSSIRWIFDLQRKDLPLLYNSSIVYISPSVKEAFGISPIEAMACGLPVVAWKDGSGTSEYIKDGWNGNLSKPYDLDDFAEHVSTLLNNDNIRKNMAENAMFFIKKNFNWNTHIDLINSILSKIK